MRHTTPLQALSLALALWAPTAEAQNLATLREAARDATARRQWGELGAVCERAIELLGPSGLFLYGRAYAAFMQGRGESARGDLETCATDPSHGEACRDLLARLGPVPTVAAPSSAPSAAPNPATTTTVAFRVPPAPMFRRVAVGQRGPSTGAVVVLSLGGASVVAAAILYGVHASETASCDARGVCANREALERAEDARGLAVAGNVALGVGLAGVLAGSLWLALDRTPEHTVTVAVMPDGATVGVAGSF